MEQTATPQTNEEPPRRARSTVRAATAPYVGAVLSGFVIGVISTLLATGTLHKTQGGAPSPATLPPPTTAVGDPLLYQRVGRLVRQQLGPSYPPRKGSRLISVQLDPAVPSTRGFGLHNIELFEDYRSPTITFRLNDHPLGAPWRFKAARADVFALLKALYTSHLPIYDVYLQGEFPIRVRNTVRTTIVLRAYMTHGVAELIPWTHWGRDKEAVLWTLLPFKSVDKRFS